MARSCLFVDQHHQITGYPGFLPLNISVSITQEPKYLALFGYKEDSYKPRKKRASLHMLDGGLLRYAILLRL